MSADLHIGTPVIVVESREEKEDLDPPLTTLTRLTTPPTSPDDQPEVRSKHRWEAAAPAARIPPSLTLRL